MGQTQSQDINTINSVNGGFGTTSPIISTYYDHRSGITIIVTKTGINLYQPNSTTSSNAQSINNKGSISNSSSNSNNPNRQLIKSITTKSTITTCIYHQDYDIIITGESDFYIRVYKINDLTTVTPINTISNKGDKENHKDIIKSLLLLDDQRADRVLLLSSSTDGTIKLWNLESSQLISTYGVGDTLNNNSNSNTQNNQSESGEIYSIQSIAFDHTRQFVFGGCNDGVIRIFSFKEKKMVGQLEGHGRGAILSMVLTNNQLLISSGMDGTIRVWDLTNKSLKLGSHFFAQTLLYDQYRDIVFAANDEGKVLVLKLEQLEKKDEIKKTPPQQQQQQTIQFDCSFKKLNNIQSERTDAIIHIYYNSIIDLLAITSVDDQVGFYPNVTGIPIDIKDFAKTRKTLTNPFKDIHDQNIDHQLEEEDDDLINTSSLPTLTDEIIDQALNQLANFNIDSEREKGAEFQTRIHDLQTIGNDLFESDEISTIRNKKFASGLEQFKQTYSEIQDEYLVAIKDLINSQNGSIALQPEVAKMTKEIDIAKKRQELIEKHKRELQEFDVNAEKEMLDFEQQFIPTKTKRVVNLLLSNQLSFRRSCLDIDLALRTHLNSSFPSLVKNEKNEATRYHQSGTLVSFHSTNVFLGFELPSNYQQQQSNDNNNSNQITSPRLVAIKMLPPNVPIQIPHPYPRQCRIYDTIHTKQATAVVMEYCSGGDVLSLVEEFPDHTVPLPIVKTIIHQILESLCHLHSQQLVVRDLQPSHVLISGDDHSVRLVHLGIMRQLGGFKSESNESGTYFCAPELFYNHITAASDIWSVGCILLFLLQTESERAAPLFHGHDQNSLLESIISIIGKPFKNDLKDLVYLNEPTIEYITGLPIPFDDMNVILKKKISRIDKDSLSLLQRMLQFIPNHRIPAAQALNHPFFTNQTTNNYDSADDNDDNDSVTTTTTTTTTSTNTSPMVVGSSTPTNKPPLDIANNGDDDDVDSDEDLKQLIHNLEEEEEEEDDE